MGWGAGVGPDTQTQTAATNGMEGGQQGMGPALDRQMSVESTMFENPFRAGGDLSKDAEIIIDALKTGKLSVISNSSTVCGTEKDGLIGGDELDKSDKSVSVKKDSVKKELNGGGLIVEPRERKKGEVDVQRGLVVNPKHAAVERIVIPEEKKQKCKCCVLQ